MNSRQLSRLNLILYLSQNLSSRFLKDLIDGALTTASGKWFHDLMTLLVKKVLADIQVYMLLCQLFTMATGACVDTHIQW